MGAPKGHEKWGGRQKGTPNKDKLLCRELVEAVLGGPIPEKISQLALEIHDKKERANILSGLMPYCYPKLTSVEVSGEIDSNVNVEQKIQEQTDAAIDAYLESIGEVRAPKKDL